MITVLVASGLFTYRSTIRHTCVDEGYQVLEAVDGLTCLVTLEDSDGNVSIVILDRDVKGVSCLDALRRIRGGKFSEVPVIVLIDQQDTVFKSNAIAAGATSCLEKPFDGLELRTEILLNLPPGSI